MTRELTYQRQSEARCAGFPPITKLYLAQQSQAKYPNIIFSKIITAEKNDKTFQIADLKITITNSNFF